MTLAKALKTKNRLAQKIKNLQREIQTENSARADDPRKIKVEELVEELEQTIDKLIKLKIAIFIASTPMRENILRLGELKSYVTFLQGINTTEGKVSNYGDDEIKYSVIYDKVWVKDGVNTSEQKIDSIQDELDKFNHITNIEV